MATIKFTKGELKRQRDALAQFEHYLPTLQLKKQQLQMKVFEGRAAQQKQKQAIETSQKAMEHWIGLLGDPVVDLKKWIVPQQVQLGEENVAGATLPVFQEAIFAPIDFDFEKMPYWVDRGLKELRDWARLLVELTVIDKRVAALERELRTTTQRVNLFEKVKIPECQENIRRIRIYLGDQMANAVGISKVAKSKISEAREEEVAA